MPGRRARRGRGRAHVELDAIDLDSATGPDTFLANLDGKNHGSDWYEYDTNSMTDAATSGLGAGTRGRPYSVVMAEADRVPFECAGRTVYVPAEMLERLLSPDGWGALTAEELAAVGIMPRVGEAGTTLPTGSFRPAAR